MLGDDMAPFMQADADAEAEAETARESEDGRKHHIMEQEPNLSSSRSPSTSPNRGSTKRMREADEDQYYGAAELEDDKKQIWAPNSVSKRLENMTQRLGDQNDHLRNVLAILRHHSNVLYGTVDALLAFVIAAAHPPPPPAGGVSPPSSGFPSWWSPASSLGSALPRLAKRAKLSLRLGPRPRLWMLRIQEQFTDIASVSLLQVLALPALVLVVVIRYLFSSFSFSSS